MKVSVVFALVSFFLGCTLQAVMSEEGIQDKVEEEFIREMLSPDENSEKGQEDMNDDNVDNDDEDDDSYYQEEQDLDDPLENDSDDLQDNGDVRDEVQEDPAPKAWIRFRRLKRRVGRFLRRFRVRVRVPIPVGRQGPR